MRYLCDPVTKEDLNLVDARIDEKGNITSGLLMNKAGVTYPIIDGIPRFVDETVKQTIESFGEEWNFFNYDAFKINWIEHVVGNTFGSIDALKDKLIVDAGGGSGMQTLWMLEAGARHVIMLELSASVDNVVKRNLANSAFTNYDVIQCSIAQPPIKPSSIEGIVICHNVIQHTPSVDTTARELFSLVRPGSEFVFNCYPQNDLGMLRRARFRLYSLLRVILKRRSFRTRLAYARAMGLLRMAPGLGWFLEKALFCMRGHVPRGADSPLHYLRRCYKATVLNTFDLYGAHEYQHHKSESDLMKLVEELQPDIHKVTNLERYFSKPPAIGCALRICK